MHTLPRREQCWRSAILLLQSKERAVGISQDAVDESERQNRCKRHSLFPVFLTCLKLLVLKFSINLFIDSIPQDNMHGRHHTWDLLWDNAGESARKILAEGS